MNKEPAGKNQVHAVRTARLFKNGKNQAVRLPKEFEIKARVKRQLFLKSDDNKRKNGRITSPPGRPWLKTSPWLRKKSNICVALHPSEFHVLLCTLHSSGFASP